MKRFWSKVNKAGPTPVHKPELGVCWVWIASTRDGYGQIWYNSTMMFSHRMSYILEYGSIPEDLCVLHKCDNRGCVRPEHLYPGTRSQNSKDMIDSKRQTSGERNPRCKLTVSQIFEIRRLSSLGIAQQEIIRTMGLSVVQQQISHIVNNKNWREL